MKKRLIVKSRDDKSDETNVIQQLFWAAESWLIVSVSFWWQASL